MLATNKNIYGRPINFSVPKYRKLRAELYKRDGFACLHCGTKAVNVPDNYTGENTLYTESSWLEVDHIVSRMNGGTNEMENLQTLCQICNLRKGRN